MAPRILICGGGYVGLYSALSLEKHLRRGEAEIVLVTPESNMTYQPFMPEAAAGNIEPRHAVVPLRGVLKRTRLIIGHVTSVDHDRKTTTVAPVEGAPYEIAYDHVIVGLGSVSRVLPVPGLAERGVGFKTVAEAIYLRNQILSCMDVAESTRDQQVRSRALTFVFVGGGYAGVEALAELEDLARYASRRYATVSRRDMRWILVEAANGILPEIGEGLGNYALQRLHERGIEVYLQTRLESAEKGVMTLSNGKKFEAETLVWTTGVKPHPVLDRVSLPKDDRGRLTTDAYLRVKGVDGAWAAGDCAAVPDLASGGVAPPTAQHALREARRLGENLAATIKGRSLKEFRYRQLGTLVSLGRYKGVARILGVRLKGFPAWFLHRTYHVAMIPTFNRKVRVVVDWTVALFFKRDVVQLGSLQTPRDAFTDAAGSPPEG
ncbi:MAG: NAD(P)/FAD-dependent oxidoreductase [Actinomycetota bacterium]